MKLKSTQLLCALLFILLNQFMTIDSYSQAIYYVTETGTGDGTSWENASGDLQALINSFDQDNGTISDIWVAAGTYQPVLNQSFTMNNSVSIYGGFNGTEASREERDWVVNPTYLKGNGASVIYSMDDDSSPENFIDGFHIIDGNATTNGGGIYIFEGDATISNCVFSGNVATDGGGAIFKSGSVSAIINCKFERNRAKEGGAIYNIQGIYDIENCVFDSNNATSLGGAIYNGAETMNVNFCDFISNVSASSGGAVATIKFNDDIPEITFNACKFVGNSCTIGGGAIAGVRSIHSYINCLFTDNQSAFGGAMISDECTINISSTTIVNNTSSDAAFVNTSYTPAIISNTILINNSGGIESRNVSSTINNSLIQGLAGGTNGNLDGTLTYSELFSDPENGDFTLKPSGTNPVINVGRNASIPAGITKDLNGDDRIQGYVTDLGAYESSIFVPKMFYVDSNKNGDGSSWGSAFSTVQAAVAAAQAGDSIFVKKGTYLLSTSIALKNGIKLYGSFDGTETSLAERSLVMDSDEMTRLDGQNATRVMEANNNGVGFPTVADGFTLQNGTVNNALDGGGLHLRNTNPRIRNCIFFNNSTHTCPK